MQLKVREKMTWLLPMKKPNTLPSALKLEKYYILVNEFLNILNGGDRMSPGNHSIFPNLEQHEWLGFH